MYKERIIQHYRSPSNKSVPESNEYLSGEEHNHNCGDDITGYVLVEDGTVVDVKFTGEGCAISMASASILSEEIAGKDLEEVMQYDREEVLHALGIDLTPMRLKCALLPRDAFVKPLESEVDLDD